MAQAIEDAIPDENLDNIVAISNGGNIRYKIGSNWYGSLKSFQPYNDYWFYTNNPFSLVFNGFIVLKSFIKKNKNIY